jgi:hypothetical protein
MSVPAVALSGRSGDEDDSLGADLARASLDPESRVRADSDVPLPSEGDPADEAERKSSISVKIDQINLFLARLGAARPISYYLVYANFYDAYSLRQQVEFYRLALTCAPLTFTSEGIDIIRGNGLGNLINITRMFRPKLLQYELNIPAEEGEVQHVVNTNLTEFHNNIKLVGKRDSIRLFQISGQPDVLYLHFYGGRHSADSFASLRTEPFEPMEYRTDGPISFADEPNVRAPLSSFCTACTVMVRNKYSRVALVCYPRGAQFFGDNEIETTSRIGRWGNCEGKSLITRIPIANIKAMVKLANYTQHGIISIYCRRPGVVRLQLDIGNYGISIIYLVDVE